ncbi:MAG: 3-hydroxy acid dehydrogenase/malonic semialdehyde reductase [Lentimonas sp.]|jgi:3-hydroxy acid dehydrogenase/malonic semialdehyde reductase
MNRIKPSINKSEYILITGATSGFGEACALLFASEGYPLILTGRRKDKLSKLSQKITNEFKVKVIELCFDVRDFEECQIAFSSLKNEAQKIGVLINNAGLAVGKGPINEGLLDDWNRMIDTNVKGLLHVSKCIIPFMQEKKSGHIINIGSIAGKEVYPGGNVYCASKHAVDALSKAMRIDLLEHKIKVTNIAPGAADTEFSNVRFKGNKELVNAVYNGYTPLFAIDIAEACYFVATRPANVNINDLVIMPTAQGSSQNLIRE